ncbi:MAG: hypothetical protein HKN26_08725 [Acidimicrobiales bacterium]|nr:hypothetical protein [Acidimicrobiales bacterium]
MTDPPQPFRPQPFRAAALAPNWLQVLAVDAGVGAAIVVVGVLVWVAWIAWVGFLIVVLGVLYIAAVGRRFLQWRWLRRQARDQGAL